MFRQVDLCDAHGGADVESEEEMAHHWAVYGEIVQDVHAGEFRFDPARNCWVGPRGRYFDDAEYERLRRDPYGEYAAR